MLKYHLPTGGIAVAVCSFVVATAYYPGGTTQSASTVGYSWTHNFVSSMFAPRALNGAANPARYIAVPAMLFLCVSLAVMFRRISRQFRSRLHQKSIEIGGIGSMVYGFLVVTPMHDLMVAIGLLFNFVALFALTHALYLARRWRLLAWGSLCVVLTVLSAVMYYGNVFYAGLPAVQKAGLLACIAWLVCIYYTQVHPTARSGPSSPLPV